MKAETLGQQFLEALKSTPLYRQKPEGVNYESWRKHVSLAYVGVCADLLHIGHISLLKQARMHCQLVVVGVLEDDQVAAYKRTTVTPLAQRLALLNQIDLVDVVMPQYSHSYKENISLVQPDLVVHGDDWCDGPQAWVRKEVIDALANYGGRMLEVPRYSGVSTSAIIAEIQRLPKNFNFVL